MSSTSRPCPSATHRTTPSYRRPTLFERLQATGADPPAALVDLVKRLAVSADESNQIGTRLLETSAPASASVVQPSDRATPSKAVRARAVRAVTDRRRPARRYRKPVGHAEARGVTPTISAWRAMIVTVRRSRLDRRQAPLPKVVAEHTRRTAREAVNSARNEGPAERTAARKTFREIPSTPAMAATHSHVRSASPGGGREGDHVLEALKRAAQLRISESQRLRQEQARGLPRLPGARGSECRVETSCTASAHGLTTERTAVDHGDHTASTRDRRDAKQRLVAAKPGDRPKSWSRPCYMPSD